MPAGFDFYARPGAQPPKVGRPSRDRSKNKAQRRARKGGR